MGGIIPNPVSLVSNAYNTVTNVGQQAVNGIVNSVPSPQDVVSLSHEALEEGGHQLTSFGNGMGDWGHNMANTAAGLAPQILTGMAGGGDPFQHVVQSALKPVQQVAGRTALDAFQGAGPRQLVDDVGREANTAVGPIVQPYIEEYHKNGVAGVLGMMTPDALIGMATEGESIAARGAGAAARAGARGAVMPDAKMGAGWANGEINPSPPGDSPGH